MTVSFGRRMRAWSVNAGLAIAMLAASGCYPEEEAPTSAPPSPLPTADSSRPEQPKPPREDQGGETQRVGSVGRDLNKDLAAPATEPGGPTTFFPPAGKPDPARPDDSTKPGKP